MATASSATGPLREEVRGALRKRIFEGYYAPGTRLVERDLAREFSVSRLPIREALRMLLQEGLLAKGTSRGMVVRSLSPADVADLFDVRESLEVLSCRLAAERGEPGEFEQLRGLVAQARDALRRGSIAEVQSANFEFHDSITVMARNEFLRTALEPLQGRMHWLLGRAQNMPELIEEHDMLAQAISTRDPRKAAARSIKHVRKYREQYQKIDAMLSRSPARIRG